MAELLTTKETLVALDNILKGANKYICLFTYNIRIDDIYLTRLRNASKKGVKTTIVFGVVNVDPKVVEAVMGIPNCDVYFKEKMHAKIFYNEKELLVGSMNLSEASGNNNFELAVLFKEQDYLDAISKVKGEAKEIIDDATPWKLLKPNLERRKVNSEIKLKGACIRCEKEIKYNPEKPLCTDCYYEWAEWENEYYEEVCCHKCGKENDKISFAKPECLKCYKN